MESTALHWLLRGCENYWHLRLFFRALMEIAKDSSRMPSSSFAGFAVATSSTLTGTAPYATLESLFVQGTAIAPTHLLDQAARPPSCNPDVLSYQRYHSLNRSLDAKEPANRSLLPKHCLGTCLNSSVRSPMVRPPVKSGPMHSSLVSLKSANSFRCLGERVAHNDCR
ncbi:hypothetical protein HDK77DRAFT_312224 [Phyllosticta capitalensis]